MYDAGEARSSWGNAGSLVRPRYPMAVQVYDGGHRAKCLRCHAVGLVRSDSHAARQALLKERTKR